jgi:hypothetical protein
MTRPFTILLTALLFSCNSTSIVDNATQSHTQVDTPQRIIFPKNVYLINNGGCTYKDSIVVDSIGNNLYVDSKSNIYFKTYDRSDHPNDLPVLISRLYNFCEGDSSYDLKRNIDIATFREIGYGYYADKKRVFYFNSMIDGGNIGATDEIDVKSFKLFPKSYYGYDKKRIYYKTSIVELADRNSFECIYELNGNDTLPTCYGKDKNYYFRYGDTCSEKQADGN